MPYLDSDVAEIGWRLFASLVCGLIVGLERGFRGKPAGIRTNILICFGSCLFMIISEEVARHAKEMGFANPDPARIAAQVVSGIGFIGAGAILSNRGIVTGLTTASMIWTVSAIGLAIGAGLAGIGILAAIAIVVIIELLTLIEHRYLHLRFHYKNLEVILKKDIKVQNIRRLLKEMNVVYSQEKAERIFGEIHYHAEVYFRGDQEKKIQDALSRLPGVRDVIILSQSVE